MNKIAASFEPPKNQDELVLAWLLRARESQLSHYEMCNLLSHRGQWLGVPVILITAVVGTSVFASIAIDAVSTEQKIAVGFLSVLAAVLSSLHTFFKYPERAEKHRMFGARFGAIRREFETLHAAGTASQEINYVNGLRERLDRLAEEAPSIPSRVFRRVQRETILPR